LRRECRSSHLRSPSWVNEGQSYHDNHQNENRPGTAGIDLSRLDHATQSEMSLHIGPLLASSRRHKNSRMIFRYSRFCNQSTMRQGITCCPASPSNPIRTKPRLPFAEEHEAAF